MRARLSSGAKTVAAAAVCLAVAAACDKPMPGVTLQAGGTTVREEATQYGSNGGSKQVKAMSVVPGETLTVDVDRQVADAGWQVGVADESGQLLDRLDGGHNHHLTLFQMPNQPLQVVIQKQAGADGPTGTWLFRLNPKAG